MLVVMSFLMFQGYYNIYACTVIYSKALFRCYVCYKTWVMGAFGSMVTSFTLPVLLVTNTNCIMCLVDVIVHAPMVD